MSNSCKIKEESYFFICILSLEFYFKKLYHSVNSKNKKNNYHIIFLKIIKNECRPFFNTLGCVCEARNHQWEICISKKKPPYKPMEPYL